MTTCRHEDPPESDSAAGSTGSRPVWYHAALPEEAIHRCEGNWGVSQLAPINGTQKFAYDARFMKIGPVLIGDVSYASDVRIRFDDIATYQLIIPLTGDISYQYRDVLDIANERVATVIEPDGDLAIRAWRTGTRAVGVQIAPAEVETAARRLFADDVSSRMSFDTVLPETDGRLRSFTQLIRTAFDCYDILAHPLVAAPMVESIVNGFLLTVTNVDANELVPPRERQQPRAVGRAIEFIEENAALPLTVADIASNCVISVRVLQAAFARHMGKSPMAYVREVRLRHAHRELCTAEPTTTSVAHVAHRWGYVHLGRFAAEYRSAYGQLPSATLRS